MLAELIAKQVAEDTCKGIFYRYTETVYTASGGRMVFSKEIRPLKRISCPGCVVCGGHKESLDFLLSDFPNQAINFDGRIKDGDIVTLNCVVDSRDRETEQVEQYHFDAVQALEQMNARNKNLLRLD